MVATLTRSLSELIPLRNSGVWPRYSTIRTLQHVYGETTVSPVQYDAAGLVWHVADHPIVRVVQVTRNGFIEPGYTAYHDVDTTGHACTFIQLASPATQGEIQVKLQGKRHPVTGGLMVYPADILWDILRMSRADVVESDVDIFRRECQIAGITVAGVLNDHTRTTRTVLDEFRQSVGAVWSSGMKNYFRLYPFQLQPNEPIYQQFDDVSIYGEKARAEHTDLITVLQVYFNYNHATDQPQYVLQLEAPEQIKRYGRIERPGGISLKWITSRRLASQIGTRYLEYRSRPRWNVSFSSDLPWVPSGGYVTFGHSIVPASVWGTPMILNSDFSPHEPRKDYTLELPVGQTPAVIITTESEIY